jgi:hypothetical protein
MNVIAATMVYNEGDRLKRWIEHYGRQLGRESLLIIDHGSDDGSTDNLGVGLIRLPRSEFDDVQRADYIGDICRAMLRSYDTMIFTDCDEIIVVDPDRAPNLRSYLESAGDVSIRPIGLEMFHMRDREPAIDFDRPILQQRHYCCFRSVLCKPAIAREPVRWAPGFHHCSRIPFIDPQLYLFHLKHVDYEFALRRQELTRTMPWSERSLAAGMARLQFDSPTYFLQNNGFKPFSIEAFEAETAELKANLTLVQGIYRCKPYAGAIYEIPERLWNVF